MSKQEAGPEVSGALVPAGETAAVLPQGATGSQGEVQVIDEAQAIAGARVRLSQDPEALRLLEHQLEHGVSVGPAAKAIGMDFYRALARSRSAPYRLVLHQELQSTLEHGVGEATRILVKLATSAKSESVRRQAASDLLKRSGQGIGHPTNTIHMSIKL